MTDKRFTDEINLQKLYGLLLSVKDELQRVSSQLRAMKATEKGVNTDGKKI